MLSNAQAKKLWINRTIDLKGELALDYLEKKYVNNKRSEIWLIIRNSFAMFWMWMFLLLLGSYFLMWKANANENKKQILDNKIEKFCNLHKEADDLVYWYKSSTRCTLIWQAQIRFETKQCTLWSANKNNCFWLKREEFLSFNDKTKSIEFWVNRYYKYDKYKTIHQIIYWWCYISPKDKQYKCFNGYTYTKEHQKTYYKFVKEYYKINNKNYGKRIKNT